MYCLLAARSADLRLNGLGEITNRVKKKDPTETI
jgi:hypothetical protein